jgi:hypothetical protein
MCSKFQYQNVNMCIIVREKFIHHVHYHVWQISKFIIMCSKCIMCSQFRGQNMVVCGKFHGQNCFGLDARGCSAT